MSSSKRATEILQLKLRNHVLDTVPSTASPLECRFQRVLQIIKNELCKQCVPRAVMDTSRGSVILRMRRNHSMRHRPEPACAQVFIEALHVRNSAHTHLKEHSDRVALPMLVKI